MKRLFYTRNSSLSSLFILIIIAVNCIQQNEGVIWSNKYPNPTEAKITSAAYGAGKILAVGNEGTLLQSTDGNKWEVCYSPMDG